MTFAEIEADQKIGEGASPRRENVMHAPLHRTPSASTSVKDSPAVDHESIDLPGTARRWGLDIATLNELQHFSVSVHGEGLLTD